MLTFLFTTLGLPAASNETRGLPAFGSDGGYMECGSAPLCGVLVLETGLGEGNYHHDAPAVHGLWPQDGAYGTSQCIRPSSMTNPTTVYSCYESDDPSDALDFEIHEWTKHGSCSGVKDAKDYFTQICGLSSAPKAIMAASRRSGSTAISDFAAALSAKGYAVFDTDSSNSQVMLSACAGSDSQWKLADTKDFGAACKGSGPAPSPSPSVQCVPDSKGPVCKADADCGFPGCVRCAHSGFCTDVPLQVEE